MTDNITLIYLSDFLKNGVWYELLVEFMVTLLQLGYYWALTNVLALMNRKNKYFIYDLPFKNKKKWSTNNFNIKA